MMMWIVLCHLCFILWLLINRAFLPALKEEPLRATPLVSILVPMRNEERNVAKLVTSLKQLTYPALQIIILDDQSTDHTRAALNDHCGDDERFRIIDGVPLPDGWVGKVNACHQLSKHATGDYLLFIDADVTLKPTTVEASLATLHRTNAKQLTGFPNFPVNTWLSQLLVPMQHFIVFFHLPLALANKTISPMFTAAHGAFVLFERESYEAFGGHTAVYNSLVEDVHITRAHKRHGGKVTLANVTHYVTCDMYETNREVWNGFTKNIFPGLGRSVLLVLLLTIFYSAFFIVPLFLGWQTAIATYSLMTVSRLIVDGTTRQTRFIAWNMPFAALALIVIMHASMWKSLLKSNYVWKGRHYQ